MANLITIIYVNMFNMRTMFNHIEQIKILNK